MKCHKCSHEVERSQKPGRADYCPKCSSALRCCMNCDLYLETAYHQCRENQAEWVFDKEAPNFCSYFKMNTKDVKKKKNDKAADARRKLDELFGE
ncbi:hypothetical protein KAR48_12325 [bacterium]|nr:hypothetical protein [bacterium]